MNVPLYERIWMWAAGGIVVTFISMVFAGALGIALQPPSHVETVDPARVFTDPRFAARGVTVSPNGATVVSVGMMFTFDPREIRVPAGRPVTFRITSSDVTHGFQIVGTNANTMVVPGYVSQFTTTFARPGEYLIVCNEYCGLGHHQMYGKLIVEEAAP
jgi:cytochrome c oxidase subunit 2